MPRDTALSIPKTSDIFRLMKDHKKLPTEKYATKLNVYLSNIRSKAEVTIDDFDKAIEAILTQ